MSAMGRSIVPLLAHLRERKSIAAADVDQFERGFGYAADAEVQDLAVRKGESQDGHTRETFRRRAEQILRLLRRVNDYPCTTDRCRRITLIRVRHGAIGSKLPRESRVFVAFPNAHYHRVLLCCAGSRVGHGVALRCLRRRRGLCSLFRNS